MVTGDESRSSLGKGLLLLGLAIAGYLGGVLSGAFRTFPYPQLLERPFRAIRAHTERSSMLGNIYQTDLWVQNRYGKEQVGVVDHEPGLSWGDYTFYTTHTTGASLIDQQGNVVHRWDVPFRQVWDDPPHVERPPPEDYIFWRRAELMPNGDVVALYTTTADTPYGYGLVRVDSESGVVWKFADHTHHDFDVRPDGSVYAIAHNFRNMDASPLPGFPQFPGLVLKDDIVHVSSEGEELERISLLEVMANSRFRYVLEMFDPNSANPASGELPWDPLHTNSVKLIEPDFAEHHAFAEPGQLMVSFRGFDAIAVVDMEREKMVWLRRGLWVEQHDATPLPNGHILLFDNNGHGGPGGASRVVEFDPSSNQFVWSYGGSSEHPFFSERRASQQLLPGGNILVTSSQSGRIFEVTREGRIVWDYLNPERRQHGGKHFTAAVCSAQRVGAEALDFELDGSGANRGGLPPDRAPAGSTGREWDEVGSRETSDQLDSSLPEE